VLSCSLTFSLLCDPPHAGLFIYCTVSVSVLWLVVLFWCQGYQQPKVSEKCFIFVSGTLIHWCPGSIWDRWPPTFWITCFFKFYYLGLLSLCSSPFTAFTVVVDWCHRFVLLGCRADRIYLTENKFAIMPDLKPVKYFRAPKSRFLWIKMNHLVNKRPIYFQVVWQTVKRLTVMWAWSVLGN